MTIFAKGPIIFLTVNALRALSVLAILLALSGEIVLMMNDLKGFHDANSTSVASTTSTTSSSDRVVITYRRLLLRREETISDAFGDTATLPVSTSTSSPVATKTTTTTTTATKKTGSATTTRSSATRSTQTIVPTVETTTETSANCAYVGYTSIPKQTGGVVFSTLDRIFGCLILIFAFFAEVPPPTKFTQRFWSYAFPPFGESFGVGVLGATQVFVGCSILSHAIANEFALVGGWFVFILGFLNMLFGLAFGASIKSVRLIFSSPPTKPSGLRTLKLDQHHRPYDLERNADGYQKQGSTVSFSPSTTTIGGGGGGGGKSRNGKNGIVIGRPMMQSGNANLPPVYRPTGRD